MRKLKEYLFYAGVDHSMAQRVIDKMRVANLMMTGTLSAIATVLITVMFVLSFNSNSVQQNRTVYLVGLLLSLMIFMLSWVAKRFIWLVTPLVYAAYSVYYLYGIFIGAITDPGGKTVTFMVMLVFMPILYVNRPIRVILLTVIYDTLFILLCLANKTGSVLSVDIIDAVFFGVLGVASGLVVNHMKIRGYVSEQKLQEISRVDQLTQVNNRNAFEFDLFSLNNKCRHSLACVYIDVNGLHELNNTKGHEYGDEMLKFVAQQIKNTFSEEFTYRVGGDEFVVFVPDIPKAEIGYDVKLMANELKDYGYYIATGYSFMNLRQLSIETLIKTAEAEMFRNKKQFYKDRNIFDREVRN